MARPTKFQNAIIADLLDQLRYAPANATKRQMYAIENLLHELEPDKTYPADYIIFRITSFRPEEITHSELLAGKPLIADLVNLIEKLSHTLSLSPEDYAPRNALTPDAVCEKLNISKTSLHRYRKMGLIAHHLIWPDGILRISYFEDAVESYRLHHQKRIQNASQFSRIDKITKARIINRARRYKDSLDYTLQEAARRLSINYDRSEETIRKLLRKFDNDNPEDAIFNVSKPLTDRQYNMIVRAVNLGVPVGKLSRHFKRSRNTIYRIYNNWRAEQLRSYAIEPVILPTFALDDADTVLLSSPTVTHNLITDLKLGGDAVTWLQEVMANTIPEPADEIAYVGAMNYLLYSVRELINKHNNKEETIPVDILDNSETCLRWASLIKYKLMVSYLHPAITTLEQHMGKHLLSHTSQEIKKLHDVALQVLSSSINTFDPSNKGQQFESYMKFALRTKLAATIQPAAATTARAMRSAGSLHLPDKTEYVYPWYKSLIFQPRFLPLLSRLEELPRQIITSHYGLDNSAPPQTLKHMADELNIPLARATTIKRQAVRTLIKIAREYRTQSS